MKSERISLEQRLRTRIENEGPITFYEWMKAALYDPADGYYSRADRLRQGREGDYRTAPETSPLFAATLASYFSRLYLDLGSPASLTIFESGAGNGEFAYGVLEGLRTAVPEVFAATTYVIDEISPAARRQAEVRLAEFADCITFQQLNKVDAPVAAGIAFSNELIDSFPVHRITRRNNQLRELYIGLNDKGFVWVERDPGTDVAAYCEATNIKLSEGQIAELNPGTEKYLDRCAALFDRGFVVTVDYGADRNELLDSPDRHQGTLRAFRRHQLVNDPLAQPGCQDLTTTIDWRQVKEAGERAGLRTLRLEPLDRFLLAEGLPTHLADMTSSVSDAVLALRLSTSARELILPTGLAASFQVCVQEKIVSG